VVYLQQREWEAELRSAIVGDYWRPTPGGARKKLIRLSASAFEKAAAGAGTSTWTDIKGAVACLSGPQNRGVVNGGIWGSWKTPAGQGSSKPQKHQRMLGCTKLKECAELFSKAEWHLA